MSAVERTLGGECWWASYALAGQMLEALDEEAGGFGRGAGQGPSWERPARLFACAAARLVWAEQDGLCRHAVRAAEDFAEGGLGAEGMVRAGEAAYAAGGGSDAWWNARRMAWLACSRPGQLWGSLLGCPSIIREPHAGLMAALARDIFPSPAITGVPGVPARPRRWEGAGPEPCGPWPAEAASLAQAAYRRRIPCRGCGGRGVVRQAGPYASRHDTEECGRCEGAGALEGGRLDPLRLSVLADCLEEGGAPAPLVAHLRTPGPHVRGCWAVDAVLGRLA